MDLVAENARLREALELAFNRLLSCSIDHDARSPRFIEIGEWADEAIAALATPAPDAPMPEHERDGFGRPVNPATPQEAVYLGQHSVTPAPDAVQDAAISEVVQHESTRRWFHGEATHEEIMECVKAMDAAVAKWRAIAGDRT